jgi:hypothetical protein
MVLDALTVDPTVPGAVLGATVDETEAVAWSAWADGERRSGVLRYLGHAGAVDLELRGVTLKRRPSKTPSRVKVEMYCEELHMKRTEFWG